MGGLRYLSGEPGRPPVRVGVSIGDTLSGLHGVIGVMMALRHREQQGGVGQEVDVALYESVFNMMESLLPEYSKFGVVRQPSGASMPGIVPTNAYLCRDGRYALIAGNGDSIYKRLMEAIGREDLATDPNLANNVGRAANAERIDAAISAYTEQYSLKDVLEAMNKAGVPAGKSYDAADIAQDPHYQARDMILDATLPDGSVVQVPGIVPKLSQTPGQITRPAPELGQHTAEVLEGLGIGAAQQADWKERGII
jgi:formyl-CoA transferase